MTVYKNTEHFNVNGDKTVEVTLKFDVGARCNDDTVLRDAVDYINFFLRSADGKQNVHKSWGRSIEIKEV